MSAPDVAPGATATSHRLIGFLRSYGIVVALVVLMTAISVFQPNFLAYGNFMNILSQWAPTAIMAVGMTYLVITGGFDLSAGAIFTLSAVVAAALGQSLPPMVAFVVAIAVGVLAGAVNGFVVVALNVNPFIATLGTQLLLSGITLILTGNVPFVVAGEDFGILGSGRLANFPYSGMLVIVIMVIAGLVLAFTPFGQWVYAIGGNAEAARLAGIRTSGVTASAYMLTGGTAGIAACVSASQLSSAQPGTDPNLVFNVLTVVIVGGTALTGGNGAIWRTAVGVLILASLQNGFNLLNINSYYQNIIKGLIIIAALATVDWRAVGRRFGISLRRETGAAASPTGRSEG